MNEKKSTSPWMKRAEAAEYLRCDISSIDKRLVPAGRQQAAGMIRYRLVKFGGQRGHSPVRLWAEDVYAILSPEVENEDNNVVEFKEAVNR